MRGTPRLLGWVTRRHLRDSRHCPILVRTRFRSSLGNELHQTIRLRRDKNRHTDMRAVVSSDPDLAPTCLYVKGGLGIRPLRFNGELAMGGHRKSPNPGITPRHIPGPVWSVYHDPKARLSLSLHPPITDDEIPVTLPALGQNREGTDGIKATMAALLPVRHPPRHRQQRTPVRQLRAPLP